MQSPTDHGIPADLDTQASADPAEGIGEPEWPAAGDNVRRTSRWAVALRITVWSMVAVLVLGVAYEWWARSSYHNFLHAVEKAQQEAEDEHTSKLPDFAPLEAQVSGLPIKTVEASNQIANTICYRWWSLFKEYRVWLLVRKMEDDKSPLLVMYDTGTKPSWKKSAIPPVAYIGKWPPPDPIGAAPGGRLKIRPEGKSPGANDKSAARKKAGRKKRRRRSRGAVPPPPPLATPGVQPGKTGTGPAGTGPAGNTAKKSGRKSADGRGKKQDQTPPGTERKPSARTERLGQPDTNDESTKKLPDQAARKKPNEKS